MLPQVSRLALSASTRNTSAVSKAANPSLKAQIRPQRSANFTSRFGSFNAAFTSQSSFTTSIAKRYYSDQLNQGWTKPPPGAEELMNKLSQKREEEAHEPEGLVRKGFGGGMGWGAFALFCVVGGITWWWGRKRRMEIEESRKRVQVAGEAKIGGTWSLIDHEGRPVCSADFAGKYPLIYFGFTYCPDICPMELKKMAAALDMLPPEAKEKVVPMMISVDPWRDSIAHLAGYVAEFHPNLIGLVGTPQQTDIVTKQFRVYTSKGPEEVEGDYLVDHSIFMYFMDTNGKFVDYYGVAMEAEEIAESMTNHLIARNELPEPGVLGPIKFWWNKRKSEKKQA